jgi:hypothetical protein
MYFPSHINAATNGIFPNKNCPMNLPSPFVKCRIHRMANVRLQEGNNEKTKRGNMQAAFLLYQQRLQFISHHIQLLLTMEQTHMEQNRREYMTR